ncbi:MAG: alpha/beta fold hydrolase [Ilumatobacteraceae bacterium]
MTTSDGRSIRVANGDVWLHVVVDGDDGNPPLVALHGITSSVRTWEWLVPHLVDRFQVFRLDFRGHGTSDRTPDAYDMEGYVGDAAAVCRIAGEPCAVLGHSLGGATAAGLAQRHPELVTRVVLEDPPIGVPRSLEGNSLMSGFRLMRESIPRLQEAGIAPDVLAGILADAPSATGPTFGELLHPDALAAMAGSMLELDATVLDRVVSGDGPLTPVFDRDRPIAAPVLLLAADPSAPDCVARAEDTAHLAAVTPHAEVVTVTGAGHLIHDELAHRDEFLRAVLMFLG